MELIFCQHFISAQKKKKTKNTEEKVAEKVST